MPRRDGSPRTSINHIVVTGYEKRKQPSKHYVFVIDVIWDNDERYEVLRRYSEFFTLHETLQLVFPSGKNEDSNSTLPTLPKRKFFGRSHVEKVAEARVESINTYCQDLIRLNSKISQSKHCLTFFSPKIGDRTLPKLRLQRPASLYPQIRPAGNTVWEEHCVIASFVGEGPSQLSAESGDQVRVVNRDASGWCLVERRGKIGWMPESYLKKCTGTLKKENFNEYLGLIDTESKAKDSSSGDESVSGSSSRESSPGIELEAQDFKAIDSYTAVEPGQISFEQDDIITVLDKMEDGWWFVAKGKDEGWVPCGYLEPLHPEQDNESISEDAVTDLDEIEKYKTIAPYTAEEEDEVSFQTGDVAIVVYKSLTGWWMIKCNGSTGLAPATYLKKITEDDRSLSNGSDSGVESLGVDSIDTTAIQNSFRQCPRQRTVRKKSRKGVSNKSHQPIIEKEDLKNSKLRKSSDPNSRSNSRPNSRQKPEVAPRKFSSPNITPNSSPDMKRLRTPVGGVNTPPRPRQTLINRVYSTPKDDEEMDDRRQRRTSPSRFNGRSPSSSPRPDRRVSPIPGRRLNPNPKHEERNGTSNQEVSSNNPYTQLAAESLIKYVLASEDPSLKEALVKIVSSDPKILKALKE